MYVYVYVYVHVYVQVYVYMYMYVSGACVRRRREAHGPVVCAARQ